MPMAIRALFATELLLGFVHVLNPPVPLWAERGGATRYLWDLDAEANVPAWFSVAQLLLLAALIALIAVAWRGRGRATSRWLGVTAAFAAFLSFDELVGIHEKLGRGIEHELVGERGSTPFDVTGPWVVFAAPLFVLAVAVCVYLLRDVFRGRPRQAALCLAGAGLFLISFAGVEAVANFIPTGDRTTVLFEEIGEMAGVTLAVWGFYELALSHGIGMRKPASDEGVRWSPSS